MDLGKIGKFIAERRKEKNLTQVQLADKICVSEKTISKWECGKGFPDTTLMLPLCNELDITANELLSGKMLTQEEYKNSAENNLVELRKRESYKDKLLLTLEWVVAIFSMIILFTCVFVASLVEMATVWRILLLIFGFMNVLVGCAFSLVIEKEAGYYMCAKCSHKYIPTYKSVFLAMHMGRTRYMKCPKCGKKSWQKKTKNNE